MTRVTPTGTRAGCIFELSSAMARGHRLVVELRPEDRGELRRLLETEVGTMATIISSIDANAAQVSKVDDRDYIVAAVEEAGGFDEVDRLVKGALREWLVGAAREALSAAEARGEGALALVNGLGDLLQDMGWYEDAAPLLRRALDGYEAAYGPTDEDTLSSVNNLGTLYAEMGRHAEAEPLYRRALDGKEVALGPTHPSTLSSVGNLGILLRDMGRHADAEPLLRRAQQVRGDARSSECACATPPLLRGVSD